MWKSYKESKTVAGFLSVLMAFVMKDAEQFGYGGRQDEDGVDKSLVMIAQ